MIHEAIDLSESEGMQWQAVDSSQISEIGYDATTATLGIRFKPGKKSPASEYHYSDVPVGTHHALVTADSVGTYFGKNIKPFPGKFPYVKVEAENPPQPPSSPNGGGKSHSKTVDGPDAEPPSPGSALALIDSMADDILFTPGAVTDAQLAAGRAWYLTEAKKYDISTEKARTELKRFARPLQKLRTGIEARAKELTGATKRKIAAIDAEKRRLVMLVGGIEDEILAPLTAWEQEEEARKNQLSATVNGLAAWGTQVGSMDMAEIQAAITALESFDLSTMQEFKVGAESAIAASLRVLKPELERRKVAEANEKELAELRRKQAERDEADRKAEAKRKEDERVEALANQKVQAVVEEVKQQTRNEVLADLATPVFIDRPTGFHSPAGVAAQQQYAAVETNATRLITVQDEAVEAIIAVCGVTIENALSVVEAIVNNQIPHIQIHY